MDLSVIICAHNEEKYLPPQLDALLSQDWPGEWEVIVVDNRSTDGTASIVERFATLHPRIRLVAADDRPNKAYAMDVGVKAALAEHVAFCDGDDVVAPGWVSAIAAGLGRHEVVTGPHELELLNPSWLAGSRGWSAEQPTGSFYQLFPAIRGANWGTSRSVWDRVGGVPEDFAAVEDFAFSLKCWLEGIAIVGLPDAVVHYRYRDNARALWKQGFAYGAYRPRVARLLTEAGRPRPPRFAGWKPWALLIVKLPTLVTAPGRNVWIWIAANRIGHVVGSIRERTILL